MSFLKESNKENILPISDDAKSLAESVIASSPNFQHSKHKTTKNVAFMTSSNQNNSFELSGGKQSIFNSSTKFGGIVQSPGPSPAPLRLKSFGRVSNNFNSSFSSSTKTEHGSTSGAFVSDRRRISNNFSSSNVTKGSNFRQSTHYYPPSINSYGRLHTNFNTSAGVGLRDYFWIGEQRPKGFGQKKA
ncbi:hypothetical protein ACQ4LE_004684 [Meloidogyne hapla]|uniref:Uncharacterized protein n=1 Tax=Meloidogyne hapla TaxID=6305 RepID=A0A1I8BIT8_MELHA